MPARGRRRGEVRVTHDLGLYAYLIQHGLTRVSEEIDADGRYILRYLDKEQRSAELQRAYRDSQEHAHDDLVRKIRREMHESRKAKRLKDKRRRQRARRNERREAAAMPAGG
ncbi:MAG: hypothetical protein GTN69_06905 [Armatimonadetes bacterium]|nr:hypothetical protein [Armatimonadota bacterium]